MDGVEMSQNMKLKCIFAARVCLWTIALAATIRWIYYSVKLHMDGIYDVHTYAELLRPVLYICLAVSVISICISFALYALGKRIKSKRG